GSQTAGLSLKLSHRLIAGVAHGVFVGTRPAADDVANAGEQVAEDVGADDDLADDDPEIFTNRAVFNESCGGDDHEILPIGFAHPGLTKLSRTFLEPTFSKSMESLLPSVAVMVP